ncbi:stage V sporulation protein AC [Eubacteriales bacterium OttesenSCG-928-K08]|nr:stage V sporulation protein AC [Eubacteriales bacterium OttesenSCG-928-K08]
MEKNKKAAQYQQRVKELAPKSKTAQMLIKAFLVGGLICCIGQAIRDFAQFTLKLPEKDVGTFTSIFLVFLGGLLTGLGVYDKIGKFAGAGSVVPITGFANSVVAPAMEHRSEGLVLGVCANLFKLAGPVLVYGVGSSIIVGLLYLWLG